MDFALTTRAVGERIVIEVSGEIDVYTAPRLREHLQSIVTSGHCHLIINMEKVTFLDSTGIGVLVSALRRVGEIEGSLRLAGPQEHVWKILRITGLTTVFPMDDTLEQALQAQPISVSTAH